MGLRAAILLILALLSEGTAMADPFYGLGYDNLDDAAAAALAAIARQPRADEQEYLAALVQNPDTGKFFRSNIVTSGERSTVSSDAAAQMQVFKGTLRALAHVHPRPTNKGKFLNTNLSDADAATGTQFKVPMYLTAFPKSGNVTTDKVLPVNDRANPVGYTDPGTGKQRNYVPGNNFLAQFPIEELIQSIDQRNAFARAAALVRSQMTAGK